MNPRTSIITPFLDAEAFLGQAIESVQAQTCSDWELLLVDDRSTDGSRDIAAAAARADARIRLVPLPAGYVGGAASARNLALSDARGDYVCFLDADDLFLPTKLERQVPLLEQYPHAAMVFGPTHWWHPDGSSPDWVEPMYRRGLIEPPSALDYLILLLRGHVPCICAVLIRRSAVEEVGGFEEQFRLYEDQTLWVKLMAAFPVFADTVVTAKYRQHPASVSAEAQADGSYDRLGPHAAREPFLDWTRRYLAERGKLFPSTERALRCAFAGVGKERDRLTFGDRLLLGHQALERRVRWTSHKVKRVAELAQGRR
jgi:hypothetical protein